MVYDGILIGLIVGLVRAGWRSGLRALSQIQIKGGILFPILLVIQVIVVLVGERIPYIKSFSGYMFMAVYAVGLYVLWLNRKEKGFWWIFAGVASNFLVMLVNGGRMPVSIDAASVLGHHYVEMLQNGTTDSKHTALTAATRLPYLADIIPLSAPYPRTQVISVGDVIMNFGIFVYLQSVIMAFKTNTSVVNAK